MPPKSKAQARLMRAVASGKARKKPKGLSRAEAKEFVSGHSTKGLPERSGPAVERAYKAAKRRK